MTDVEQQPAELVEGDPSSPQSAFSIGPMVGLVVAAVALLAYGWLSRTPQLPLSEDFSSISSVLWRTSFVVAVGAVLVALYLIVGTVYQRSQRRRTRFLAYTAPALFVLAFAAVQALHGGAIAQAFTAAGDAQLALRPFAVTVLARAAWWCACLAVGWLAVASIVAYLTDPTVRPPKFSGRVPAGAIAVAVAVALTGVVVWRAHASPFEGMTADRIDAPVAKGIRGEVAYRAEVKDLDTDVRPGGAGFVHLVDAPSYDGDDRVEGFDGATGMKRWSFGMPKLDVSGIRTTGTGPDSVVLIKTYMPIKSLLGLDATTGAVLWARSEDDSFDADYAVSPSVALFASDVFDGAGNPGGAKEWRAVSPRTGDVMWTKTIARDCYPRFWATDSAVLMRDLCDGNDVVARVLDPRTGDERSVITVDSLGIDPATLDQGDLPRVEGTAGDRALIGSAVVDVTTGRVLARVPDGQRAFFIDSDSVLVAGNSRTAEDLQPVTILDLRDGTTIPTGLFLRSTGTEENGWGPVARSGNQWFTMLLDARAQNGQGSIVAKSGAVTTVENPCEDVRRDTPSVVAVPGAVLVACADDSLAGIE